MKKYVYWVVLASACGASANVEKYYRKMEGKSEQNRFETIDFVYMINLDQRPEKYLRSAGLLNSYGIYPYRFSAVNGWELTLEQINDIGTVFKNGMNTGFLAATYLSEKDLHPTREKIGKVGRTYFHHEMTRGAIGILVSHLSILQDAYDAGYETIWVFEDDIEIIKNPNIMIERVKQLDELVGKEGWDILFTDRETRDTSGKPIFCKEIGIKPNFLPPNPKIYRLKKNVGEHFQQIGARYGAYSMIVRRSGMSKILKFIRDYGVFLPYDVEYCLPPGIKLFTVLDDVIQHQCQAASDNRELGGVRKEG